MLRYMYVAYLRLLCRVEWLLKSCLRIKYLVLDIPSGALGSTEHISAF